MGRGTEEGTSNEGRLPSKEMTGDRGQRGDEQGQGNTGHLGSKTKQISTQEDQGCQRKAGERWSTIHRQDRRRWRKGQDL